MKTRYTVAMAVIAGFGLGPLSLVSSWRRQERRLTWIELHVEGGEKRCCPGIIAHEGDEIDQCAAAELP